MFALYKERTFFKKIILLKLESPYEDLERIAGRHPKPKPKTFRTKKENKAYTLQPKNNYLANMQEFFFSRIQYHSGDWNTDQRMPANMLNSLVEYTSIPVEEKEHVIRLDETDIFRSPFCYLSGHKLVEFNDEERKHFEQYIRNGGFVFVDDCNHDIDALFAISFERQMAEIFGKDALKKIPNNHPLYDSFFEFPDGPPTTSFELNGWGDDLVHDYLKAIEIEGRMAILYSNKDYGCEWDYHFKNKRFLAEDNTKFAINIVMNALSG